MTKGATIEISRLDGEVSCCHGEGFQSSIKRFLKGGHLLVPEVLQEMPVWNENTTTQCEENAQSTLQGGFLFRGMPGERPCDRKHVQKDGKPDSILGSRAGRARGVARSHSGNDENEKNRVEVGGLGP